MPSGNAFDEAELRGFDQQNADGKENNFISTATIYWNR